MLRHVSVGHRTLRDEDADIDTAAAVGPASTSNIDADMMKVALSRRIARPTAASFDTGETHICVMFLLLSQKPVFVANCNACYFSLY